MNTSKLPNVLKTLCQDFDEVTFSDTYSGRFMYGRTCVSLSGLRSDILKVIGQAILDEAEDMAETARNGDFSKQSLDLEKTVDTLLGYCSDSMGKGVVFYWPSIDTSSEYHDKS